MLSKEVKLKMLMAKEKLNTKRRLLYGSFGKEWNVLMKWNKCSVLLYGAETLNLRKQGIIGVLSIRE